VQNSRSYSSKLLLFGEYSVLLGSPALSIPFHRFSARLSFSNGIRHDDQAGRSNHQLRKFCDYLEKQPELFRHALDLDGFSKDLAGGLFFESGIPVSYGLGSSGALCAAVYGSYGMTQVVKAGTGSNELARLRSMFGAMESFFHGKSSGFDPLVIYMNAPLCIDRQGQLSVAEISADFRDSGDTFFLADTGRQGKTGALVPGFLARFAPDGRPAPEGLRLSDAAGRCVDGLLTGNLHLFRQSVQELSSLQLDGLRAMIPDSMIPHWKEGLGSGLFHLKLCGSGGGGYLLGLTQNIAGTISYFSSFNIPVQPVD
jgi:mevalonate kinase